MQVKQCYFQWQSHVYACCFIRSCVCNLHCRTDLIFKRLCGHRYIWTRLICFRMVLLFRNFLSNSIFHKLSAPHPYFLENYWSSVYVRWWTYSRINSTTKNWLEPVFVDLRKLLFISKRYHTNRELRRNKFWLEIWSKLRWCWFDSN